MDRHFGCVIATLLTSFATALPVAAQETLAKLAAYAGPDRAARLAADARREGELSIYTSLGTEDAGVLAAAFEKKYGVKL